MTVRVRFAPAPSGELHVGSTHTALFNWLFARHVGGVYMLRIEDTDRDRAKPEFIDPICDALEWLGLDWDEGPRVGGPHEPYLSSGREDLHAAAAKRLLEAGVLYRCWCTAADREARGLKSGYDRFCRTRADTPEGPAALRLAVPEGEGGVDVDDLILGRVRKEYHELMDPVVVRSDGSPLYPLAVTVDDIAMEITHVIRGGDLLDNTFVQVLLYRAMGAELPKFAHVPVILGPDRAKLGKRHGSETLQQFRADGILPEALLNYLALLGWSSPSLDEILSRERLIEEFTLDRVNPSNSVFDHKKLRWMNQQYLMKLEPDDLVRRVLELAPGTPQDVLRKVIDLGLVQARVETLAEIPSAIRYLHERPDAAALGEPVVGEAARRLESLEPWTPDAIKDCVLGLVSELGLDRRKGPRPLYVAISGSTVALPLFESIFILGREETVARLRAASGS